MRREQRWWCWGLGSKSLLPMLTLGAVCIACSVARSKGPTLVRTLKPFGGRDTTPRELYRLRVTGVAKDADGKPVAGAAIYAIDSDPGGSIYTPEASQTTSDASGRFALDVEALVQHARFQDPNSPLQAAFTVLGIAEGYGFTWESELTFHPQPRPEGEPLSDETTVFFLDHSPKVTLHFEPAAVFEGVLTDDSGEPLVGASVQLGMVRREGSRQTGASWRCRYVGDCGPESAASANCLGLVAENVLSTTTDEHGGFRLARVRACTEYLALVDPGPRFNAKMLTVVTAPPSAGADAARNAFHAAEGARYTARIDRPRRVEISIADPASKAVTGAVVTAFGKHAQLAGAQQATNTEGIAQLDLPPGKYRLLVEPPLDEPLLYLEAPLEVGPQEELAQQFKLPAAAVANILVKDAESGEPQSDVLLAYQMDGVGTPVPLSTRSHVSDYRLTDAEGCLTAFLPPGSVTFSIAQGMRGGRGLDARAVSAELSAGETSHVTLQAKQVRSRVPRPTAELLPTGIAEAITRQMDLIRHATGVLEGQTHLRSCDLELDDLRRSLDGLDAQAMPDIDAIYREWTGHEFVTSSIHLSFDPPRRVAKHFNDDGTLERYQLINGAYGVSTMGPSQIDVYPVGSFPMHVPSLADFVEHARATPAMRSEQVGERFLITYSAEGTVFEQVVDAATGFLCRSSLIRETGGRQNGKAVWQFAPRKYDRGLRLPKLRVEARVRDGRVQSLDVSQVSSVKLVDSLSADTFAAPGSAGMVLLDHRDLPRGGPGRPATQRLTAPVQDVASYVLNHSRGTRSIEPKLTYGQPAPPLPKLSWLTPLGESVEMDAEGKVILIEFWATSCGPCINHLDELIKAADEMDPDQIMLVGLHAAGIDRETLKEFTTERGINYPVAIDSDDEGFGTSFEAFGVRGIPQTAVIDRSGKLVYLGQLRTALQRGRDLIDSKNDSPDRPNPTIESSKATRRTATKSE